PEVVLVFAVVPPHGDARKRLRAHGEAVPQGDVPPVREGLRVVVPLVDRDRALVHEGERLLERERRGREAGEGREPVPPLVARGREGHGGSGHRALTLNRFRTDARPMRPLITEASFSRIVDDADARVIQMEESAFRRKQLAPLAFLIGIIVVAGSGLGVFAAILSAAVRASPSSPLVVGGLASIIAFLILPVLQIAFEYLRTRSEVRRGWY